MAYSVTGLPIPLEATEQQRRLGETLLANREWYSAAPGQGVAFMLGVIRGANIAGLIDDCQGAALEDWVFCLSASA